MLKCLNRGIATSIAVGIIAILVVLVGGGILAYQYYYIPKQEIKNPVVETPKTETPKNEITDWKAYKNEVVGYEIKYPSSYTVATSNCYNWKKDEKLNDEKSIIIGDQEKISVHICYFNGNASDFFRQEKFIPITIGGRSAFKNEFEIRGGGRGWYYIQKDNSNVIFIDANWAYSGVYPNTIADEDFNKRKQTIDQIISTFKFITQTDQTAGWKTYTSNELKYSFKYPANWKVIPNSVYSAAGFGGLVGYTITTSNSKIPPDNERIDIGGAQVDCVSLSNLNRQEHPAGVLCKTNYPVYTFSTDPQVISVFNLMANSISDIKSTTSIDQTAGLKTYNSNLYGFTLEYPNVLTLKSTDSEFSLYHSVPFKHSNPCNLKDGASIDVITDFNVTGTIKNGNIDDVLRSANYYGINFDSNGKPIIDENSDVKEFKNVNLIGYYYSMGSEGCGVDVYYFSLKNNKTLVLRDIWVGEFSPVNGYTGQYDRLAGVILPDKHSEYLNQILSTFKFAK